MSRDPTPPFSISNEYLFLSDTAVTSDLDEEDAQTASLHNTSNTTNTFEITTTQVEQKNLKISSSILNSLQSIVDSEGSGGDESKSEEDQDSYSSSSSRESSSYESEGDSSNSDYTDDDDDSYMISATSNTHDQQIPNSGLDLLEKEYLVAIGSFSSSILAAASDDSATCSKSLPPITGSTKTSISDQYMQLMHQNESYQGVLLQSPQMPRVGSASAQSTTSSSRSLYDDAGDDGHVISIQWISFIPIHRYSSVGTKNMALKITNPDKEADEEDWRLDRKNSVMLQMQDEYERFNAATSCEKAVSIISSSPSPRPLSSAQLPHRPKINRISTISSQSSNMRPHVPSRTSSLKTITSQSNRLARSTTTVTINMNNGHFLHTYDCIDIQVPESTFFSFTKNSSFSNLFALLTSSSSSSPSFSSTEFDPCKVAAKAFPKRYPAITRFSRKNTLHGIVGRSYGLETIQSAGGVGIDAGSTTASPGHLLFSKMKKAMGSGTCSNSSPPPLPQSSSTTRSSSSSPKSAGQGRRPGDLRYDDDEQEDVDDDDVPPPVPSKQGSYSHPKSTLLSNNYNQSQGKKESRWRGLVGRVLASK